jgi:hypothetical protein
MALSNAERQKRYRERRKENEPVIRWKRPQDRKHSRPQQWRDAVETLKTLQSEYQEWLDNLPEMQQGSATEEKLQAICDIDLDAVEVEEFPRGFGRD